MAGEFLGFRCGIQAIQALIHMRSSMPCSKLRACAGVGNCFELAGILRRNGNGLAAPQRGAAAGWSRAVPPISMLPVKTGRVLRLRLVRRNMASGIASSLRGVLRRRRDRRSDPPPRLACSPVRKHREVASLWPSMRPGCELIEGALPYSHGAETRYELDEMGLRCSIALPLGMDGRQERL
jgi:hypothetical protein